MSDEGESYGFVATKEVKPLGYDFTGLKGFGITAKGIIAEPSQEQVKAFLTTVRAVAPQGNVLLLRTLDVEEAEVANAKLVEAIVKVCSGKPSKPMLDKLPFRMAVAFTGYIYGSLTNPK